MKKFCVALAVLTVLCVAALAVVCWRARADELKLCKSAGIGAPETAIIMSAALAKLRPLKRLDGNGREREVVGVQFPVLLVDPDRARQSLDRRLKGGYVVFISEINYGIGHKPDKLGVMRVEDRYDVLRARQTNGTNYGLDNEAVIARLKTWEHRYRFKIVGAEFDWVEIEFSGVPPDLPEFAREVYKFCPDTVDQGMGTVKALANDIATSKRLFLWWD